MKYITTLIFTLTFINVVGQTYLSFHKDRPAYYKFEYNDIFYSQAGISIDSFKVNGSDTVFYHYKLIDYGNDYPGYHLISHDTSFAGVQSIRSINMDDKFFNRRGDTIVFKNNSLPLQSWTMTKLGGGNKIIATVQSIVEESILGITDSVKIIRLQATDNSGINIPNIFNNKIFKIGKSFGLINGYSMFHFPIDTISFSLIGIENPSLGLSSEDITPEKVFDFNIGDRFDYISGSNTFTYHSRSYVTKKIIFKQVSFTSDSLVYMIDYKTFGYTSNFGDYNEGRSSGITIEVYSISNNKFINDKPFQWSAFLDKTIGGTVWLNRGIYSPNATVKNFYNNYFNFNDTCLQEIVWGLGPGNIRYASGLGKTYRYYEGSGSSFDTLVYYNKVGIEWGDSIDWKTLGTENINHSSSISIFPNPSDDFIFINGDFSSSQMQLTLLNYLGEEIRCVSIISENNHLSIDIRSLSRGIYLLQLKTGNGLLNRKFIKN